MLCMMRSEDDKSTTHQMLQSIKLFIVTFKLYQNVSNGSSGHESDVKNGHTLKILILSK